MIGRDRKCAPWRDSTRWVAVLESIQPSFHTVCKSFAEAHGKAQPQPRTPEPATAPLDPLCGFSVSPAFVMMVAPQFRDFTTSSQPTRADIVSAAWHVREHLGISQDAWGEACYTFGRWEAAVALAAVTGRYNAGEVRSPGGLLRKLIKLYGMGELRLDRTLRGLAARLVSQQSQAAGGDYNRARQSGHLGGKP